MYSVCFGSVQDMLCWDEIVPDKTVYTPDQQYQIYNDLRGASASTILNTYHLRARDVTSSNLSTKPKSECVATTVHWYLEAHLQTESGNRNPQYAAVQ